MLDLHTSPFETITHDHTNLALKNHPQLPIMLDVLNRKEQHHLLVLSTDSEKIHHAIISSIAAWLRDDMHSNTLRDAECIYLASKRSALLPDYFKNLERDFHQLREKARINHHRIVLAISYTLLSDHFLKLIQPILNDPQWRMIIFTEQKENLLAFTPYFTQLRLYQPTQSQYITLLNHYKTALEEFHHAQITEETVSTAFALTQKYLPRTDSFHNALELLDSAAARANEIVTTTTLLHVLSSWTHIPLTCLQNNALHSKKMNDSLQREVIGQDAAITTICNALQRAAIKLREKEGPLCRFLLVGPEGAGKTTTIQALAEYLFGDKNALLMIDTHKHYTTMSEITLVDQNSNLSLLAAIEERPYSLILLENIQHATPATFALFKNIIMQGYAFDQNNKKYDFRHAIIAITTTVGAEHIATLTQAPPLHELDKNIDLIQLVMNDHPEEPEPTTQLHLSNEELRQEILPLLENYFSNDILHHLHIVPFLPLDNFMLEKIIRKKVDLLAKKMVNDFAIELAYTSEVIAFLAHEMLLQKSHHASLETLLEEKLYACVSYALWNLQEDNQRGRLFLQLHDNGQMLKCEMKTMSEKMIY